MSGSCWPHSLWNPEEREFVVDSGASMHMVSQKDLNSAELETVRVSKSPIWSSKRDSHSLFWVGNHEDIEGSEDSEDGKRRGANKRRSDSVCQRIGFIRDSKASRRYTSRPFTRKTVRRSGVKFPLDRWSATTPHQKCQEDQLQHSELRTLRCPWSVDKFFNFIFAYFTHIGTARTHSSYTASRKKEKWEYAWHRKSTERSVAWTSRNPKSK